MLCWCCDKVKGKRACPARGGESICSRCCGTKRRVEIQCPEDCPYLYGEHDARWESATRETEETRFIHAFSGVERERLPVLVFMHQLLLQARRDAGGKLTDEEIQEVVSTLARTFETRAKGILYEHQSESLQLQGVVRWLGQLLDRREEIEAAPPASDQEILAVLQVVASAIRAHREQSPGRGYWDIAERVFHAGPGKRPSIELPGEGYPRRLIVEP
ncbi:MAG: hypothetical protein ACE5JI_07190 [Acidobacteriota bacterium]